MRKHIVKSGFGKALVVALGTFVLVAAVVAVCQVSGSGDMKAQSRAAFSRHMITIDDQVKRFAESLNLSETQRSEVRRILEFRQAQTRRIRFDESLSGAERISRLRGLQDSTVARIRAVLNDEQKKKYDPLLVRKVQNESPPASVEDWMKAAAAQK
jgi:hypothetical protein